MNYRKLGRSNIPVSEIGFGAWTIGLNWWGKIITEEESKKMLRRAHDLGITFYDTADIYGKGKSEKLIGETFKDIREQIIYSTKWGYDIYNADQVGHSELPQKHDTEFLKFALKQSLSRLQTDYIDVYSLHNPKMYAIQNYELFQHLDNLVHEGKIKSHGVALGPAIGWEDEGRYSIRNHNISYLQTVYNILEQEPGSKFLSEGAERNVGILARVPDASGVLTGKVTEKTNFDKDDHRGNRKKEWIAQALKKIENMKDIADDKGWSITELAIKFILSQPQISVVLPTITSIEDLERFAELSDGKYLNRNEMRRISVMYNNNFYVDTKVS
jgi:aryl-alcohol dehydrogenase-like predicted oxidoreductase